MNIDLSQIDREQFMLHEHVVNGEVLTLVQPQHIGCKWTKLNRHLRSSVWNYAGDLVSAGFPKFVNWGENPDNFSVPTSLEHTTIVGKIDGSLLIVSKYKGNYIIRTRGTLDATKMDNGHEIETFKSTILNPLTEEPVHKYLMSDSPDSWNFSLLFEWYSPLNRIVIRYGDSPKWFLVGVVNHEDYSLMRQDLLNRLANNEGLNRPPAYTFTTVSDLLVNVNEWTGVEGVCVYSYNDQEIHKCKGDWYLSLHRMKDALSSYDKVIDVWYEQGEPSYQEFELFITNTFDWELWTQIRGDASRICDGAKEVQKILDGMAEFVLKLRNFPSRKEQALHTISSYGKTNRASFIFKLLDNKELEKDDRKKLMYQVTKK